MVDLHSNINNPSPNTFTIAYTIFNKGFLVKSIINSLARFENCKVLFFFDNCTDDSLDEFHRYRHLLQNCTAYVNHHYDYFETRANNYLLSKSETMYTLLVQDDMILSDVSILESVRNIYSAQQDVGLVGFKDGYEMDVANQYYNFASSPCSTSKTKGEVLAPGQAKPRTFVNRGPLCVPRTVIDRVGLFDTRFSPLFWDDNDLSIRCTKKGFKNFVAHGDVLSKPEWGATRGGTKLKCKHYYLANQYRFAKKWNIPDGVSGRSTLIWSSFVSQIMRARLKFNELWFTNSITEI